MTASSPLLLTELDVSRETVRRLTDLEAWVTKWSPSINLVAKSTIPHIALRHILDSAQIFALSPAESSRWVDLGSGGGFPGLVIAILAKEQRPAMTVTLVESDLRKAAFLREAARNLDVSVDVKAQRIEILSPLAADVISARALAPLTKLLAYAAPHMQPGGLAIFPKGARADAEIATARQNWNFVVDSLPSVSDSKAAILMIRNIQRADQR